jgi:hypothetical protein
MVQAAMCGIPYSDYILMDSFELACYIRGYAKRELSIYKFLRWMAAIIVNCWAQKTIQPTDLIKFEGEEEQIQKSSKKDLKRLDSVFEKWDKAKK